MNRREIIAIYNKFPKEKQNVPIAQFIRQIESLTDPVRAQQDAMQIVHGMQQQRVIDAAVRGNDG
jgi:hypothetical protein